MVCIGKMVDMAFVLPWLQKAGNDPDENDMKIALTYAGEVIEFVRGSFQNNSRRDAKNAEDAEEERITTEFHRGRGDDYEKAN